MANYNEHWPLAWKFMENLSRQIFRHRALKKLPPLFLRILQRLLFIHFTSESFASLSLAEGSVFGLLRGHNGLNVQFVFTSLFPFLEKWVEGGKIGKAAFVFAYFPGSSNILLFMKFIDKSSGS